jgi:hypothetical protein
LDEETIMVSKTLASLDASLALAEGVLAEQNALNQEEGEPEEPDRSDQPSFFPRRSSHPR